MQKRYVNIVHCYDILNLIMIRCPPYSSQVSLAPTHWSVTNKVMARNRRLGVSMSGLQQFIARAGGGGHGPGLETLRVWCEEGYTTLRYIAC